ncbi:MAG TPA: arginine deiminase-related protein [Lacipirellulaceae bacterium]|nr:arginine deiminase-related protein [Lacipirellulaceae bacterium]
MKDTPHILMCPPDFYGIQYEINPWMDISRQSDHAVAVEQWHGLHRHIIDAGACISQLQPVEGLPDLVFTANAAMIFGQQALISRFRHRQRQGEEPYNRRWLAENGFDVVEVPENFSFEGAGDALFCGDTLYAGYRMRSDAAGHQEIGRLIGCRVIPVELIDARYYHLDTCFCPLAEGQAIWYPPAFDEYGQLAIRGLVPNLIEVEREEAERFACNAVVIGKRVITNTGCDRLHAALAACGYEPIATPLDEFVKAGGSAKCLTLRLDGEEAAAWKATF